MEISPNTSNGGPPYHLHLHSYKSFSSTGHRGHYDHLRLCAGAESLFGIVAILMKILMMVLAMVMDMVLAMVMSPVMVVRRTVTRTTVVSKIAPSLRCRNFAAARRRRRRR